MKPVLYSTPTCTYCHLIKIFFKKNKIEFEEIDISKDEKKKKELVEKTGKMSVPVTIINGTIVAGYDMKKIKELLGM